MEDRKVTGAEYEKTYIPFGGFILVRKDVLPEKSSGGVIITETIREDHGKFTTTGVVVKKSLFTMFEDDLDLYIFNKIKIGDRVGFSGTVPLMSPSPPYYQFNGDDKETYVTIHIRDILCVICETEEETNDMKKRFDEPVPAKQITSAIHSEN